MDDAAARRAEQIWQRIQISAQRHLPADSRKALLEVIRAYGEARFDAGRAHESALIDQRELQIAQKELEIRVRERALA